MLVTIYAGIGDLCTHMRRDCTCAPWDPVKLCSVNTARDSWPLQELAPAGVDSSPSMGWDEKMHGGDHSCGNMIRRRKMIDQPNNAFIPQKPNIIRSAFSWDEGMTDDDRRHFRTPFNHINASWPTVDTATEMPCAAVLLRAQKA